MKLSLIAAAVAGVLSTDVLVLDEDNFKSTLSENSALLVEFYAPWCGHCKSLAPKYEEAATTLKGVANIASVDCTENEEVCKQYDVRGYPTVKFFRNGEPSDYPGAREADAIVSFMKKQVLPAVSVVEAAGVEEFIASDKVAVLGYFAELSGAKYTAFAAAAEAKREAAVFGAVVSAEEKIVLHKTFDEGKNDFEGDMAVTAEIAEFVALKSTPLMADIGPDNYATFVDSGLPLAYLFVADDAQRKDVGAKVEVVAAAMKGKVNFVYIDAAQYGGHAANVGLEAGSWPAFSVQEPAKNTKYPFAGEITTEAIQKHVEGIVSGELKPTLKSAVAPAEQGNVVVVVGNEYKEIVEAEGKDVLIEFYAPWCGHCKSLAPIYEELGDSLASNDKIVIAKMDATENDLPLDAPFQVTGFPTIKFYDANNKIHDYDGSRDLDGFLKFLKATAVNSFEAVAVEKDEL